jgi:hypothetical protein
VERKSNFGAGAAAPQSGAMRPRVAPTGDDNAVKPGGMAALAEMEATDQRLGGRPEPLRIMFEGSI